MGVLNATPDSFFAASRTPGVAEAVSRAAQMLREGADVLDIGGESTRPGAVPVPEAQELDRIIPLLTALRAAYPDFPISIDTQKAEVARQALARGVSLVNDISAMRQDPEMPSVVADSGCGVVLMHMQGTPATMQQDPRYENIMDTLKAFFDERLAVAVRAGISQDRIIIDPGIGFGKTMAHNLTILQELASLKTIGRPILIGVSRKSFIGKILNQSGPEDRLEGSIAAALWAIQQGASGVRVHDVGATRHAIIAWETLNRGVSA